MNAALYQLNAHGNMTASECLEYCARNANEIDDVLVVSVQDGRVILRSSKMTREFAVLVLLDAVDQARGISR